MGLKRDAGVSSMDALAERHMITVGDDDTACTNINQMLGTTALEMAKNGMWPGKGRRARRRDTEWDTVGYFADDNSAEFISYRSDPSRPLRDRQSPRHVERQLP
jgi:hypothetical protein